MSINFDIKISNDGKTYKIVSSPPEIGKDARLILLEKIERIVRQELKYDPNIKDEYSEDPINFLMAKVPTLRNSQNSFISLVSKIFTTNYQTNVERTIARITGFSFNDVPKDVIFHILKLGCFSLNDLNSLARTNNIMKKCVNDYISNILVKEFGAKDFEEFKGIIKSNDKVIETVNLETINGISRNLIFKKEHLVHVYASQIKKIDNHGTTTLVIRSYYLDVINTMRKAGYKKKREGESF